jgi:hypothetical protein
MQKRYARIAALFVCVLSLSNAAVATSAPGTMGVTATVASSMSLTFTTDASGVTVGGTGTSAGTLAFGAEQAFGGTVATGVTRVVNGTTNWTISTPFDVNVAVANQTSATYTLTAQLQSADATNTWKLGATTITSASAATLTAAGAYGLTVYILNLTIPFSASAGTITNTLNFVATAN